MEEKPIHRIRQIIVYKKLSVAEFEKKIKMSNGSISAALKHNTNVKAQTLNNILDAFPDISPEWLLTGKGSMFNHPESFSRPDAQQHLSNIAAAVAGLRGTLGIL